MRWGRWLLGSLAVLLVCCVGGAGALVGFAGYAGALDQQPRWVVAAGNKDRAPTADASVADWRIWVFKAAGEILAVRGKAINTGDEKVFLSPVDPANTKFFAEEKRRFQVLRRMEAGVYREVVTGTPNESGLHRWRLDTEMFYCFGPATCEAVRVPTESEWVFRDGQLRLTNLKPSTEDWNGPRPWEIDDIQVRVGQRVVMMAMKSEAWRLTDAVKSADNAALVADKFARWHEPPSRYVISLAGSAEWARWYGHEPPGWAGAWAVPVGDFTTEVVVRINAYRSSTLQGLLSHELTHATSLAGDRKGYGRTAWWLAEGIADYAQFLGKPVRQYDALAPTREFVHGSWDGFVAVDPPGDDASVDEAAARYGVAFLAIRRIADKHGQSKMIDFFGAVVHQGKSLDAAATSVLGASWSAVQADCAKFVRASVG